jgi:hypothetical protein
MMWDRANGVWVPDPSQAPKDPKATAPQPPKCGATEDDKREWLRTFSVFDGREWSYPDEYRAAYKKAKRPANDSERRVQQRRESPKQQAVHRATAKGKGKA